MYLMSILLYDKKNNLIVTLFERAELYVLVLKCSRPSDYDLSTDQSCVDLLCFHYQYLRVEDGRFS